MKSIFTSVLNDSAVLYGILHRGWAILAGIVTVLIISYYLPANTQGYYYTFLSLIALQAFLELGLYVAIVNFASHEWSGLSLNINRSIQGDVENLSRLVSLGRGIVKWYGLVSILFVLIVGLIGFYFFPEVERALWFAPWCILAALSGVNIFLLPMISLLEGCGQIRTINKFRFTQALISSFALWISMYAGAGLWALAIAALIVVLRDLYLILVHYREFFKPFWHLSTTKWVDWKNEIWPMQWRLALQAVSGYFLLQLITPVIFKYHGSIEAGRIGMSMQIIGAIQSLGLVWLQTKVPLFGGFIAQNDLASLNKVWARSARHSVAVVAIVGMVLVLVVAAGNVLQLQIMERLVGPWQFGFLVIALVFSQMVQAEAAYLRAFKKEPFLLVGVIGGVVAGLLIWFLGSREGVAGAIIGYALSMGVVLVWATRIFLLKAKMF